MSVASAPKSPAKTVTKPRKAAKPADHPKYITMVAAAIGSLKERGGSSRQAILKYVMANYKVGNEIAKINARVKTALKSGVKASTLKQAKGTGATGSFRLGEKKEVAKPKPKKPETASTKKPKSLKKKTTTKKATTAKTPAKKATAAKPKKVKTPKRPLLLSLTAAKPKKVKTPKRPLLPSLRRPSLLRRRPLLPSLLRRRPLP